MKPCHLAVALLAVGFARGAQTVDPAVRMIVTEQKYCLGQPGILRVEKQPPDAITLRLMVHFLYRNSNPNALIIPEEDPTLILSRSLADVTGRKNQFAFRFRPQRHSIVTTKEFNLDRPDSRFFLVVRPGGEGESSFGEYIVMRVHNPSESRAKSEWLGKKLFLQLDLDHGQFPKRFVQDLAAKWREYGELWTGKVRTEPLEVDVPASPKFGDCSREYTID